MNTANINFIPLGEESRCLGSDGTSASSRRPLCGARAIIQRKCLRGFRKVEVTKVEKLEQILYLLLIENTPPLPFGGGGGSSHELLPPNQGGCEPWRDYS